MDRRSYKNKKLVVFDLDGTLAESKSPVTKDMAKLLGMLTKIKMVAVISGASWQQFEKQFLPGFAGVKKMNWNNLSILPTCGASFYSYTAGWKKEYSEKLSSAHKKKIHKSFERALKDINYSHPEQTYGPVMEDRGTQITFSALGQHAPVAEKATWDPDSQKRLGIKAVLDNYLPEFNIRVGGSTSIDITLPGIDKAYGIKKMIKYLGVKKEEILFVGDALFPGGNDYPAKEMGVDTVQVKSPIETVALIKKLLKVR